MAEIGNTYLTLADLRKRQDENDMIATIIELLAETNEILEDAVTVECNDGTKHLTTMRTGLPSATWRKLYQSVQPDKSTTKQVTDTTGMLEAWSEVDAKLVDISGNPGEFRLSEATAFIEAMNQEMATGMFYHDTAVDPEKFMGLAPRFSDLSAENGNQIVDAGGSGSDLTSIWMIVWGERTCHLLYPKGSQAGLQRDDKGMQTKETSSGVYDVYREKFTWDIGMSVRDWRYVVRIANLETASIADGAVDLYKWLRKGYWKLKNVNVTGGRPAIYCNADVMEGLDAINSNSTGTDNYIRLRPGEKEGKEIMTYRGMPLRRCDAILNTESQVT